MTYEIAYNKDITDIKKENGKYVKYYKNGTSIETTASDAAYLVAGMQYYFLTHKGKEPVCKELAANPSALFDTVLTDTGEKSGNPLISEDDTLDILTAIMCGFARYNNNKSKNNEIGYGIGYMAYKLFEAYEETTSKKIYEKFIVFITKGTFVIQMKRKPLAVQIYLGIYDAWIYSKKIQEKLFSNQDYALDKTCNNTIRNTTYDSIHDVRNSTSNMRRISIDNVILTYCITGLVVKKDNKTPFLDPNISRKVAQMHEFTNKIFTDALPAYDTRCTYYFGSEDERNKMPAFADEKAQDVILKVRPASNELCVDDCPYLYYLLTQIGCSKGHPSDRGKIATSFTGKTMDKLDPDCTVLWERDYYQAIEQRSIEKKKKNKKILTVVCLLTLGLCVYTYNHPGIICIIALCIFLYPIGLFYNSIPEKEKEGSGVGLFVDVSSGNVHLGWWI